MDLARKGEDGSASAFRGAASSLGSAIGVAVMTTIVFTSAAASLSDQAVASGVDSSTATEVAGPSMRDGATSEDTASLYSVPVDEVEQIDSMQRNAYLVGLHVHGLVGGAVTLAATVLFYVVRRRQEHGNVSDRELPVAADS